MKKKYTRKELIELCEKSFVPVDAWSNRDSAICQEQIGKCWILLKDDCDFKICTGPGACSTNENTIWIEISIPGFSYFEGGSIDVDTFYIPTEKRLKNRNGKDWY